MKEKAWIVVFPMIFWSFFDLYFTMLSFRAVISYSKYYGVIPPVLVQLLRSAIALLPL